MDIKLFRILIPLVEIVTELTMLAWISTGINITKISMPYVRLLGYVDQNQRRWVEYNDYFSVRSPNGDKVPPKWHGWLAGTYDEVPTPDSTSFFDPFFERPHQWNPSNSVFQIYTPRQSIINPTAVDFYQERRDRYAK